MPRIDGEVELLDLDLIDDDFAAEDLLKLDSPDWRDGPLGADWDA